MIERQKFRYLKFKDVNKVEFIMNRFMIRGGNAEKRTFDWVIATLKDGCVFVEWVLGFNFKYFKFHFGH